VFATTSDFPAKLGLTLSRAIFGIGIFTGSSAFLSSLLAATAMRSRAGPGSPESHVIEIIGSPLGARTSDSGSAAASILCRIVTAASGGAPSRCAITSPSASMSDA
jgi:hypothetical protein